MLISIFYLTSLFLIKNKIKKDEYDKHLKKCWMECGISNKESESDLKIWN